MILRNDMVVDVFSNASVVEPNADSIESTFSGNVLRDAYATLMNGLRR